MRRLLPLVLAAVLSVGAFACTAASSPASPNDQGPAETAGAGAVEERPPLPRSLEDASIVVYKSERRMVLLDSGEVVREYRVGLGKHPEDGDKEREGDSRTPEGRRRVCGKENGGARGRKLWIDYPNADDARRGYRDGLISKKQRDAILRAMERGKVPPFDTGLGGAISIHGGGSSRDWTAGCIAIDDEEMSGLYRVVPVGTPVEILP